MWKAHIVEASINLALSMYFENDYNIIKIFKS